MECNGIKAFMGICKFVQNIRIAHEFVTNANRGGRGGWQGGADETHCKRGTFPPVFFFADPSRLKTLSLRLRAKRISGAGR